MKIKTITAMLTAVVLLMAPFSAALCQSKKVSAENDVAMELVGAVLNPSPASSLQYGYITYINGVGNIFSGSPQNETTALFTFYNESTTVRVINNGPLRIVNREGTTTIYLDTTPDGDFSNPDSFRDGASVMTSNFKHQVVLDTTTNTFTTTFANTITSTDFFVFNGEHIRLGRHGQTFRTSVFGRASTSGPGQFVIAGFVAGGDLTR